MDPSNSGFGGGSHMHHGQHAQGTAGMNANMDVTNMTIEMIRFCAEHAAAHAARQPTNMQAMQEAQAWQQRLLVAMQRQAQAVQAPLVSSSADGACGIWSRTRSESSASYSADGPCSGPWKLGFSLW